MQTRRIVRSIYRLENASKSRDLRTRASLPSVFTLVGASGDVVASVSVLTAAFHPPQPRSKCFANPDRPFILPQSLLQRADEVIE